MPKSYLQPGLLLSRSASADANLVREFQRDLRALGYLHSGIDGVFGRGTESAIRALRFDLLNNTGASRQGDGSAPVAVKAYNHGSDGRRDVEVVNGVLDQGLARCIRRMIEDDGFVKVPRADDPVAENRKAIEAIAAHSNGIAPTPIILAIVRQESGSRHFRVPAGRDSDDFLVVGLDRGNSEAPDQITSRGYGIGQFTIFHHPPRPEEVDAFLLDPARNVARAYSELREKLDRFLVGPADVADDRIAEHGRAGLRTCRYDHTDPRHLSDCRACAREAPKADVADGTPVFTGSPIRYTPTSVYQADSYGGTYPGVPVRAAFPCDWPYAIRRYNGGGLNSFHYQTRILLNLVNTPP